MIQKAVNRKKLIFRIIQVIFICILLTVIIILCIQKDKEIHSFDNKKSSKVYTKIQGMSDKQDSTAKASKNTAEKSKKPAASVNSTVLASSESSYVSSTNYKEYFKNDVFIGDSITQGLSFYEYIDEKNVYAKLGVSLHGVNPLIDKAKGIEPSNIFLLLGANDVEDKNTNCEQFTQRYKTVIEYIKEHIPNAHICVQAIFPIQSKAEKNSTGLTNVRITEFNSGLKSMAAAENIQFIDTTAIFKQNGDELYEQDGEHIKAKAYPLWLNYIEQFKK